MANFKQAYNKILKNEGGYCNHPDDRGGETYKGIARNFHKYWEGWAIIDKYNKIHHKDLNMQLEKDIQLQSAVESFYRITFWNVLELDLCGSQKLAEEIFDDAVNTGIRSAIKKFQKAIGTPANGVMTNYTKNKLKEFK